MVYSIDGVLFSFEHLYEIMDYYLLDVGATIYKAIPTEFGVSDIEEYVIVEEDFLV